MTEGKCFFTSMAFLEVSSFQRKPEKHYKGEVDVLTNSTNDEVQISDKNILCTLSIYGIWLFSTYLYCHLHVLNTIYFQWIASIELEEPHGILTPRLGKQEGFIKCPLENALSGCPLRKGIVPVLTNMPNDNSRLVKEISMYDEGYMEEQIRSPSWASYQKAYPQTLII